MDKKDLEKRLDFLEFRQDLLFENTNTSRLLFEYRINKEDYNIIMDIMDDFRKKIGKKEPVNYGAFEQEIYNKIPDVDLNYHFCEAIARAFMEDDRWTEVFINLYGNLPKYKNLIKR